MRRGLAIVVCTALAAALGGCTDLISRQPPASLKDDVAAPVRVLSVPARTEIIKDTIKEPAKAETAKPEPAKADSSVVDKAKAEQAARCGQRHMDHAGGTLKETENEKQLADAICVELHKYDYVR
jgi:hypothetical protein